MIPAFSSTEHQEMTFAILYCHSCPVKFDRLKENLAICLHTVLLMLVISFSSKCTNKAFLICNKATFADMALTPCPIKKWKLKKHKWLASRVKCNQSIGL